MSDQHIKARCNKCQNETNHRVVHLHATEWSNEIINVRGNVGHIIDGNDHYQVLECAGCNEIQFLHASYFSEDPGDGWHLKFYPPRLARDPPEWAIGIVPEIPRNILDVLNETYIALQNDIPTLAIIGTRTVLDMVISDKLGDSTKGFKDKVGDFAEKGYIAPILVKTLSDTFDAGNAAAHRGYKADENTIGKIFDIVEGIIVSVYILPEHADAIKDKTPQRKPENK